MRGCTGFVDLRRHPVYDPAFSSSHSTRRKHNPRGVPPAKCTLYGARPYVASTPRLRPPSSLLPSVDIKPSAGACARDVNKCLPRTTPLASLSGVPAPAAMHAVRESACAIECEAKRTCTCVRLCVRGGLCFLRCIPMTSWMRTSCSSCRSGA